MATMPDGSVAESAGLSYKQTVDALGRMLNAGTVGRFDCKYSAVWALTDTQPALRPDALESVEALSRTAAPTQGGEA